MLKIGAFVFNSDGMNIIVILSSQKRVDVILPDSNRLLTATLHKSRSLKLGELYLLPQFLWSVSIPQDMGAAQAGAVVSAIRATSRQETHPFANLAHIENYWLPDTTILSICQVPPFSPDTVKLSMELETTERKSLGVTLEVGANQVHYLTYNAPVDLSLAVTVLNILRRRHPDIAISEIPQILTSA